MTDALPYGAREIVEVRMTGKRPADMVLVSLIGPLRELNPVVIANPTRCYDWRFTARLEVLIVANTTTDKGQVKRVVDAVLQHEPGYLGVWFANRQSGLNIAFGLWRPRSGRAIGKYERQSLVGIGART